MRISSSIISFDCNRCDETISEEGFDLPGFDYSAEVHSDGCGLDEFDVVCPGCGKEYTVQITNMFDQFEAEIPDEADIEVTISVEADEEPDDFDYDEYLKSYVPAEPRERYEHSLVLLDEIVAGAGALTSYPMFHRMVLLQHVAMMEAYLSDRLITAVAIPMVCTMLIQGYPGLRNQQYPLVALASNPNLIAEKTATFLKAQLYHELDAVEQMYTAALGATPFVDEQNKLFLKGAMISRHHCVHRDGKDNDGLVLKDVDGHYVEKVRQNISALVSNIETKFATTIAKIKPLDLNDIL